MFKFKMFHQKASVETIKLNILRVGVKADYINKRTFDQWKPTFGIPRFLLTKRYSHSDIKYTRLDHPFG